MSLTGAPLLQVRDLAVNFRTHKGTVHAIDHVSLCVSPGEMLGIVGESGSGKSVSAYALLQLLESSAEVKGGTALLDGQDLLRANAATMRGLRGSSLSMIFQNPRSALNAIRTVGDQLVDVIMAHQAIGLKAARVKAIEALRAVRITDPERRFAAFPFELSGGMCQRVMIALALACSPRLLIADEPTTGLDVTTQATIMDLISELCRDRNMAVIFITHDLSLASEYCDRIAVMHAGQVVEIAATPAIFESPCHPYTRSLFAASVTEGTTIESLVPAPGAVPDLRSNNLPACRFFERCSIREVRCKIERPLLRERSQNHDVACWGIP